MGKKRHKSKHNHSKVVRTANVIARKQRSCKTICKFLFVPLLMAILCFADFRTHNPDNWHTSVISFQPCEESIRTKAHCYILRDTSEQQYRIPKDWFGAAQQQQLLTDVSVGDPLYIRWHRTLFPNRKFIDTLESDHVVYRSLDEAKQEKGYGSLIVGIFFSLIVLTGGYFLYKRQREIYQLKQCRQEFLLKEEIENG